MKLKHTLIIAGLILAGSLSECRAVWDTTTPAGTEAKSLGDDRIREFKTDIQTALNTYGVFPGTDTANPKYYWTIGSGSSLNRPTSVSTGTLFVNVSSGCIERYNGVSDGWSCVQVISSHTFVVGSTFTAIIMSTQAYDYFTGDSQVAVTLRNNAVDTSTMNVALRFWVGDANETRIVAIRTPLSSDSADLAINVKGAGNRYEPQRWKSDGTVIFNSSNTYNGTNLFKSSATFQKPAFFENPVTFSSSVIFTAQPKFFAVSTTTLTNVTGNGGVALAVFGEEQYDTQNSIFGSTFTATTAGYWELSACIDFTEVAATSSEHRQIIFFVNQTNWATSAADYSYVVTDNASVGVTSPSDRQTVCGSFTRNFALNDKVVIRVQASGGTGNNVDITASTSQALTWFEGRLLN